MNDQQTSLQPPAPQPASGAPQPWDRQEDETQEAFTDFTAYLNLGPRATLQNLFVAINPDPEKPHRTLKSLQLLAWRNNWHERAAAWRQHLAHLQSQRTQKLVADTTELWAQRAESLRHQQWEFFHALTEVGHQAVQEVFNGKVQTPRYDELPRIFNALIKIARQSVELPAGPRLATAQEQAEAVEIEMALNKGYGAIAAAGVVPDVKAEVEAERTAGQPPEPPTTPPAAPPATPTPDNPQTT